MFHTLKLCAALWPCLLLGCTASLPPSRSLTHHPPQPQVLFAHAQADEADLRVMSFNLRTPFILDGPNHWTFRDEMVVDTIRRFQPDLLGTQECVASQAWYLYDALPGYDFVGAGRNDGHAGGEMCAIFYRLDRFRRLDSGHFWLSETPDKPGSKGWDAMWRRMVTWVELESRRTGRRFVFFNTHFDSNGDTARLESAKLLRQRIDDITRGNPAIVTGDFNTPADSAPYRILLSPDQAPSQPLIDTWRDVHAFSTARGNTGTRHGFGGSLRGPRIDWILTTDGFDTLAADIDHSRYGSRYPSDHFPVTATLRWNLDEVTTRMTASRLERTDG